MWERHVFEPAISYLHFPGTATHVLILYGNELAADAIIRGPSLWIPGNSKRGGKSEISFDRRGFRQMLGHIRLHHKREKRCEQRSLDCRIEFPLFEKIPSLLLPRSCLTAGSGSQRKLTSFQAPGKKERESQRLHKDNQWNWNPVLRKKAGTHREQNCRS